MYILNTFLFLAFIALLQNFALESLSGHSNPQNLYWRCVQRMLNVCADIYAVYVLNVYTDIYALLYADIYTTYTLNVFSDIYPIYTLNGYAV